MIETPHAAVDPDATARLAGELSRLRERLDDLGRRADAALAGGDPAALPGLSDRELLALRAAAAAVAAAHEELTAGRRAGPPPRRGRLGRLLGPARRLAARHAAPPSRCAACGR
jgi:hypothetical protein